MSFDVFSIQSGMIVTRGKVSAQRLDEVLIGEITKVLEVSQVELRPKVQVPVSGRIFDVILDVIENARDVVQNRIAGGPAAKTIGRGATVEQIKAFRIDHKGVTIGLSFVIPDSMSRETILPMITGFLVGSIGDNNRASSGDRPNVTIHSIVDEIIRSTPCMVSIDVGSNVSEHVKRIVSRLSRHLAFTLLAAR